jgi:phosphatidate cytidylyltransferase
MLTRSIAGLALVPLFIVIAIGGLPLYIAQTLVVLIALYEFYKAFKVKGINPIFNIGYIFTVYLLIKNIYGLNIVYTCAAIFILFVISIMYLLKSRNDIIDIAVTFFGVFYVAMLLDHIILTLNDFQYGSTYVWLIFVISFATDTFAYFSGYLFGKHKLIPKISPKKTIEGSIGGILGSTIFCILFAYIFKLQMLPLVVIGSVGSVVAQFGDLFASSIKRYVGIKDYGKLIPGHGGILDRFDSVILVAPFVYYAIMFFIH